MTPPYESFPKGKKTKIWAHGGVKEGCPLSAYLLILYYDVLTQEVKKRPPTVDLYVYMDGMAIHTAYRHGPRHGACTHGNRKGSKMPWAMGLIRIKTNYITGIESSPPSL